MELIGNIDTIVQTNIAQKAAEKAGRALPHMIYTGAAGCGKTSMARYLSRMTGYELISVACDALKCRLDVALLAKKFSRKGYDRDHGNILNSKLIQPTLVFIDEIHNLSLAAQEHLGILMEEWSLSVTPREARLLKARVGKDTLYWVPQFTLIGATTNDGKLSKPFRDRFKMRFVFTPYSLEESVQIVFLHAKRLKVEIDEEGALEIAKRGRGVPRVLVSLLERCRDSAIAINQESITKELALVAFFKLKIDPSGLTESDVTLLRTLHKIGDPVGLDNLATILNESPKVLSETIEPYLIQRGLMLRASKGRSITEEGCKYLAERGYIEKESGYDRVTISKDFDRGF
jgi:holliday junction DNA helicase RuvB